jgi:hypothetical protein
MHANSHPFPNDDLRKHGAENGWPARLFGAKRSEALIGAGIALLDGRPWAALVRRVRAG